MHKKVTLKPTKEKSILRRHPWVFSGAIKNIEQGIINGDIVEIINNKGRFLGYGHYNEGSIAVRLFEFSAVEINESYWKLKLERAIQHRLTSLNINKHNNIYRLVHAEGDDMPGCIIDVYNNVMVIQFHSIGMWRLRSQFAKILAKLMPEIDVIYDKSENTIPGSFKQEFNVKNEYLLKKVDDNQIVATENGNQFIINWETGQKTGFFIDQRENRKLLAGMSKDKKVLNTFCYSGGFSIYALNAGAKEVHSLDSSKKAMELVKENVALLDKKLQQKHKSITQDAMDYIKNLPEDFDVIILDPPAFAKHIKSKNKAVQGYKRLNTRAIEKVKSGGLIFTFSCSQVIDNELFKHIILSACIVANRKVSILHQLHQPQDHPVNIYHPESEYLKGLVIKVY
tara:strand:- start:2180 stop:3370 length:1191 start_codon:yes stop_codon:yes gene_type:complete